MDTVIKMGTNDSAKFLLETGLLFEINLRVLHPFGLALSVTEDDITGEVQFSGLNKTNNLTGWEFSDEDFLIAIHKLKRFVLQPENRERLTARKLALGSVIQNESDKDIHITPIQVGPI